MKKIPLIYLVKAQDLYVQIFDWEDDDGIPYDEYKSYIHSQKAYEDYIDKCFLDDRETAKWVDSRFNTYIVCAGTFEELCDGLRNRGYEVLSASNSTKEEIRACKQQCLKEWREWKKNGHKVH